MSSRKKTSEQKNMIISKYITKRVATPEDYKNLGGFEALEQAKQAEPNDIIQEIKRSGLRGRGGAGFPTGLKWEMAASYTESPEKYIICNADEGEVGAFKDRVILENCPYLFLEGLIIAGIATGAQNGFIYLRDEYSFLQKSLEHVIEEAGEILKNYNVSFSIHLRIGAGAYICGEETSLIESLEGKRGEPKLKPPYPPQHGLFGMPTVINNVETISNIPWIIVNGAENFSKIGTEFSAGTKLFSVSGDVRVPGVYELVMGVKIGTLVKDYAGAEDIKAVQVGGASGRILSDSDLEIPLCFEGVLGSGAVIVFNHSRSIVETMRETMAFFMEESCGKCTPCREGNFVIYKILDRMNSGLGSNRDILMLKEIASSMSSTSFCGLGTAATIGLMDALELFADEFQQAV